MNCLPSLLLAIALLFGTTVRAAEPKPAAPASAPATQSAKPADAPQPGAPQPDAVQSEPKAADADERFKPSEKISEDLSVSFPADI